ncbi:MAG: CBS domain-containing protein, partial [Methanosarcinales archaeon]
HDVSRLVVVEGVKQIGIITKSDIVWHIYQKEPMWKRRPIDHILVQNAMSESLITIYPDASIKQAIELMLENKISGLPVVEGENELIGIITKKDIAQYLSSLLDLNTIKMNITVEDIMDDFVVTVHRDHSISHVIHEMEENKVDIVIVLESDGTPVGIITKNSLAFIEIEEERKTIKMTRKASHGGRKQYRYVKEVPLIVDEVMTTPLITIESSELATKAFKIMVLEGISALPVLKNKELIGLITKDNIIEFLLKGDKDAGK